MAIKVNVYIRHNNHFYEPGDIIKDISKTELKRLVKKGLGEEVDFVEQEDDAIKDNEETTEQSLGEESVAETLELNFNNDELKAGAKEQNIDFKANISKKALIELIISEEATEHFLEQLED